MTDATEILSTEFSNQLQIGNSQLQNYLDLLNCRLEAYRNRTLALPGRFGNVLEAQFIR